MFAFDLLIAASMTVIGFLPPVVDDNGDLLVDGGKPSFFLCVFLTGCLEHWLLHLSGLCCMSKGGSEPKPLALPFAFRLSAAIFTLICLRARLRE